MHYFFLYHFVFCYVIFVGEYESGQKSIFLMLDPSILNNYNILSSCSSTQDNQKFGLTLVQKFLEMSAVASHSGGIPNAEANQVTTLITAPAAGLCLP
jgi:hypothetical protein